ncbi:hypothetical protein IIQ43_12575 [Acinetobacter oleivorans]|uniref:Uncharacterized protein n=1 Tax=Acinetobacter oleivorans TaxID=1148157 RepID=A0ABR9NL47_9GAMM|nr:hypothetical protein [Acinetobacter oleivorans]MBE2165359.1 hypothetical protein [Acinetobacter oleivorans]
MTFEYQGQEYTLDPKKVKQNGSSYIYEDVFLCDDNNIIEVRYLGLVIVITTKQFPKFHNVHNRNKSVKPQFITSSQSAQIGFLNRVDSKLSSTSVNIVSLEVDEQLVLGFKDSGNVKFPYPKDQIIERLSNAIRQFLE